jgi:hypothetical protein
VDDQAKRRFDSGSNGSSSRQSRGIGCFSIKSRCWITNQPRSSFALGQAGSRERIDAIIQFDPIVSSAISPWCTWTIFKGRRRMKRRSVSFLLLLTGCTISHPSSLPILSPPLFHIHHLHLHPGWNVISRDTSKGSKHMNVGGSGWINSTLTLRPSAARERLRSETTAPPLAARGSGGTGG